MYKRLNVYPNGSKIPDSLPDSYQPAVYGEAPTGQSCFTCKNFNLATRYCSAWKAPVKPRWWCKGWEQGPIPLVPVNNVPRMQQGFGPYKRIATSVVEEHFSEQPKLKSEQAENVQDSICLDVPLMIRLLEYTRESVRSDIELHYVAERLVELSEYGDVLDMASYEDIVNPKTEN